MPKFSQKFLYLILFLLLVFDTFTLINLSHEIDAIRRRDFLIHSRLLKFENKKNKMILIKTKSTEKLKYYVERPSKGLITEITRNSGEFHSLLEEVIFDVSDSPTLEAKFKEYIEQFNVFLRKIESKIIDGKKIEARKIIDSDDFSDLDAMLQTAIKELESKISKEVYEDEKYYKKLTEKTETKIFYALLVLFFIFVLTLYLIIRSSKILATEHARVLKSNEEIKVYKDIIDEINMVSTYDKQGKITYINDNFTKVTKYTEREILGESYQILHSGYHSQEYMDDIGTTLNLGHSWSGLIKSKDKEGNYFWQYCYTKALMEDKEVAGYISIASDRTQEHEDFNESLKLEHLASIGLTTAQIFHDVMTPLSLIKMCTNELKPLTDCENAKVVKNFDRVDKNIARIEKIFKDMRGAIVQKQSFTIINVSTLITRISMDMEALFDRYQIVYSLEGEDEVLVQGNETQLEQVFSNLFTNSIDAIKSNEDGQKWINVQVNKQNRHLVIELTDSGEGIDVEIQERIFDKFFTTKQNKGGSGLGLGICKKMMQIHGGDLTLDRDSRHTCFVVRIPIY